MEDSNNKENKKNFFGDVKKSFSGRKFRSGAYVTLVSGVVIVMVLVANMLFSKINLQFDLSNQGMYTLTTDTTEMLKDLKDDITIYYLVKSGDEVDQFKNIVKQYDAATDKISVIYKDPILYPQFASKYVEDTINVNSFLVVDKKTDKAKYVDYEDLLVEVFNQETSSYDTTGIDVEGELTSAIQYVTSSELPKMYVLEGHGEITTGETFNSTMDKMNVSVASLATISAGSIPTDCNILFINSPTADFSDEETTMIKDYLAAGGKAIITLDYNAEDLTNFKSILDYYGIEVVDGRVIEGDSNMHASTGVNILLPNIEIHDITMLASDNDVPVVLLDASGLLISDTKRSTLTVEPLLTTSDSSYSKMDPQSTTAEKEDGDVDGPFNLGLVATDSYNGVTTNVAVFSSAIAFGEETATFGNLYLLTGTVGYFVGDTKLLSIPTKSLESAHITPSQQKSYMLGAMAVIIIPVIILIFGGVVCYRRRRK